MRNVWLSLLLISQIGSAHGAESNGPISGGGGDLVSPFQNSAWFLGEQNVVKVCYQIAGEFPFATDVLREMFARTYHRWLRYIDENLVEKSRRSPLLFAKSFEFSDSCGSPADLRLIFGVRPPEVVQHFANFSNPAAFSVRTEFDGDRGWGRGFIWFEDPSALPAVEFPNLTQSDAFEILMLHEVGHLFGNGNVDGTIMDEGILARIKQYQEGGILHLLANLDLEKSLSVCRDCSKIRRGFGQLDALADLFQTPILPGSTLSTRQTPGLEMEIVLQSPGRSIVKPINFLSNVSYSLGSDGSFKAVRRDSGNIISASAPTHQVTRHGVVSVNGHKRLVVVTWNSGFWGPVLIDLFDQNYSMKNVFTAQGYE